MDLSVFEAARAKPAPEGEGAAPAPKIVNGVDISFFESARAKPADKPAARPAAKPRPMDDAFDEETRKDTFSIGGAAAAVGKRLASFTIGNAAAIVDMIAGAPTDLAAIGIEGRKRAEMQYDPLNPRPISPVKTLRSKSDTEIAKEAAKLKSDFREKYGEPLKKVLTHLGVEDIYNTSEVAQALQFLGGKIQEGGGALEKATGGKVRSEDALALFEQTLAAVGVAGTPAALRTTAKAAPKVVRGLEPQANFPADGKIAQVNMPPLPALPAGLNEALMRPIELRVGRRLTSDADIRRAEAELNNDAVRNGLLDAPSLVDAWQKRRDKAQGPELDAMRNAEQQAYKLLQSGASTQQVERALATARSRGIPLEEAMSSMMEMRGGRSAFADIPEVPIREDGTFAPRAKEALLRSETAPSRTELAARIAAQGGRIDPALGVGESAPGGRIVRRPSAVRYDEFGNPIPTAAAPQAGIDPMLSTGESARSVADPKRRVVEGSGVEGLKPEQKKQMLYGLAAGGAAAAFAMTYGEYDNEAAATLAASGALLAGRGRGLTLEAVRALPDATPLGAILDRSQYTLSSLEMLPKNRFEFSKQQVEQLLKRQEVTKAERDVLTKVLAAAPGETITAKQLMQGVKEATGDFELKRAEKDDYATYGLSSIGRVDKFGGAFDEVRDPAEFVGAEARLSVDGRTWEVYNADGDYITTFVRDGTLPDGASAVERARVENQRAIEGPASATTTIYQSPIELGTENHFNDPNYFAHTRSFVEGGVRHVVELQSDVAQKAQKVLSAQERAELERQLTEAEDDFNLLEPIRRQSKNFSMAEYRQNLRALPPYLRDRVALRVAQKRGNYESDPLEADGVWLDQGLTKVLGELSLAKSELKSKLTQSDNTSAVRPMFKDWHKRLVREEVSRAAQESAARAAEREIYLAEKQRELASAEADLRQQSTPKGWAALDTKKYADAAYDLRVMAMDLKNGHVSEGTVRQYMLKQEQLLPPEARQEWREFYETYADETEGFLRPGKGEDGEWGSDYASAFPHTMANFFDGSLGKPSWTKSLQEHVDYLKRQVSAAEKQAKDPAVRFATADTVAKVEGWPENPRLVIKNGPTIEPATRFSPEHQGIYDRYQKDVTKFLKSLGGKEVTDDKGHTWIEVPLEPKKDGAPLTRTQMFGVGAVAAGSGLLAMLTEDEQDAAAPIAAMALFAKSRSPAVRSASRGMIESAESVLGNLSTSIRNISESMLRPMRRHELNVLKHTYDRLKAVTPFVERLRGLPQESRAAISSALFSGAPNEAIQLVKSLDPGLLPEFVKVRKTLAELGEGLVDVGKLKGLRPEYFPRIVVDYEGLLKHLGADSGSSALEKRLFSAERMALTKTGEPLSHLDRSVIISDWLSQQMRGPGKAGFLKKRSIDEVTKDLLPFYAPADESLILYVRAATAEIERARFFGRHLVRDPETSKVDLDASIHNIVEEKLRNKEMSFEQAQRLKDLIWVRFGPGERGMSGLVEGAKNLGYAALLAQPTSALVQLSDVATVVYAHSLLPTIKAVGQTLTGRGRITTADFGLIDNISAETASITGTARFVNKVFKLSGFNLIDRFGKSTAINAALDKYGRMAKTDKGIEAVKKKYGEYFGDDLGELLSDLRAGRRSGLVDELIFSELSDLQPVSRIEMPRKYLEMTNGRALYMLKSFMLKQADIVRRDVWSEWRKGNKLAATNKALRFSLALGIGGASTEFLRNWLLGRDDELEWTDIPANMLKTFMVSEYVLDQPNWQKKVEALGKSVLPPVGITADIVGSAELTLDWLKGDAEIEDGNAKAIRYIPIIGTALYHDALPGQEALGLEFGGAERSNRLREQREWRKELRELRGE